jgi:MFS transporter, DHA2 family, multidrug resistance protein
MAPHSNRCVRALCPGAGQVQGHNAEQIGSVLAWTGLPQLIPIPLVPKLLQRFDTPYIAFTGLAIFAYSCFMNTAMSSDDAGDQLWIPNIARHRPGDRADAADLGDNGRYRSTGRRRGVGYQQHVRQSRRARSTPRVLAIVITKREQFHSYIIGQSVTLGREEVRNRIAQ